jgi:hypothetical protein
MRSSVPPFSTGVSNFSGCLRCDAAGSGDKIMEDSRWQPRLILKRADLADGARRNR